MKEEVSEEQKIGNVNKESNCILKCLHCGEDKGLSFVGHRNKEGCITGLIVVCQKCLKIIGNTKKNIRMVFSDK